MSLAEAERYVTASDEGEIMRQRRYREGCGLAVFHNGVGEYDMIHDEELKVVDLMTEHCSIAGEFQTATSLTTFYCLLYTSPSPRD